MNPRPAAFDLPVGGSLLAVLYQFPPAITAAPLYMIEDELAALIDCFRRNSTLEIFPLVGYLTVLPMDQ